MFRRGGGCVSRKDSQASTVNIIASMGERGEYGEKGDCLNSDRRKEEGLWKSEQRKQAPDYNSSIMLYYPILSLHDTV